MTKVIAGAVVAAAFAAGGCDRAATSPSPQDAFWATLQGLCGGAYEGRLVSNDAVDSDFAGQRMVVDFRECTADAIRAPFHVGEDRSRTWVITRTQDGLRLKHDHRHEDGEKDAVTWYGGDSRGEGTAARQEFPVDQYSIELFEREGLDVSTTNIWALEATDALFAYELSREGRFFRVEFDASERVDAPPPPWGWDGE